MTLQPLMSQSFPRSFYEPVSMLCSAIYPVAARIAEAIGDFFTWVAYYICCFDSLRERWVFRTVDADYRAQLFNPKDTYLEKGIILNHIASIPAAQRNDVVQNAMLLIDPGLTTTPGQKQQTINDIIAIPVDQRNNVVQNALLLIDPIRSDKKDVLDAILDIPAAQRNSVVRNVALLILPCASNYWISRMITTVQAIPDDEREEVILYALQLITPGMFENDRIMMIEQVVAVPANEREEFIRNRLEGVHNPAEGVNVHEGTRDLRTRKAIILLRERQRDVPPQELERAKNEFIKYLEGCDMPTADKQLAKDALLKEQEAENFEPLLDGKKFKIADLLIAGEEVLGRLWIFAGELAEPEQTNAKKGMISALKNSYEQNSRVCNQGKTQRLLIAVLQGEGRLKGVNIDAVAIPNQEIQATAKKVTTGQALTLFLQGKTSKNKSVVEIDNLVDLLKAAEQYCADNDEVNAFKEDFIKHVREYAVVEKMPEHPPQEEIR